GGRGAAALDVAEHRGPRLFAGPPLDLSLQPVPDPAQADVAEGVVLVVVLGRHAALRLGALGDDDDRREVAGEAAADQLADLVDVELALGDEDRVGAAGEAGVEGDP